MGKNSAVVFLSNRSRARRRARDRSLPLAGVSIAMADQTVNEGSDGGLLL
jgi:hypothetical protein